MFGKRSESSRFCFELDAVPSEPVEKNLENRCPIFEQVDVQADVVAQPVT